MSELNREGVVACELCGREPAAGFAMIGDDRYCHGDDDPEPTCYMRSQWKLANLSGEPPDFAVPGDDLGF